MAQRYSLPESPHKLALTFLIEKVDRHFERAATYGLVICDHVGSPSEDSRYRKDFLELQLNGPMATSLGRFLGLLIRCIL